MSGPPHALHWLPQEQRIAWSGFGLCLSRPLPESAATLLASPRQDNGATGCARAEVNACQAAALRPNRRSTSSTSPAPSA